MFMFKRIRYTMRSVNSKLATNDVAKTAKKRKQNLVWFCLLKGHSSVRPGFKANMSMKHQRRPQNMNENIGPVIES